MAYDLHIVRPAHAAGGGPEPIGFEEWLEFVRRSPDLRLEEVARATNPETGEAIEIGVPGRAVWSAHPRGAAPSFRWSAGHVTVGDPDDATLAKLKEMARAFGACVEGERYDDAAAET